ncbi:hypothetical protein [Georgenia sp. SUBG003]|uniref:hypothetical protein n=1 Tax=Georgenia sp. SUBG003 TaxID=1497974 RepID=UPI003AB8BDE8
MNGSVLRAPGMPLLLAMTVLGFSGYAALLPVAPCGWCGAGPTPAAPASSTAC